jgi:hypothetical protein
MIVGNFDDLDDSMINTSSISNLDFGTTYNDVIILSLI